MLKYARLSVMAVRVGQICPMKIDVGRGLCKQLVRRAAGLSILYLKQTM